MTVTSRRFRLRSARRPLAFSGTENVTRPGVSDVRTTRPTRTRRAVSVTSSRDAACTTSTRPRTRVPRWPEASVTFSEVCGWTVGPGDGSGVGLAPGCGVAEALRGWRGRRRDHPHGAAHRRVRRGVVDRADERVLADGGERALAGPGPGLVGHRHSGGARRRWAALELDVVLLGARVAKRQGLADRDRDRSPLPRGTRRIDCGDPGRLAAGQRRGEQNRDASRAYERPRPQRPSVSPGPPGNTDAARRGFGYPHLTCDLLVTYLGPRDR